MDEYWIMNYNNGQIVCFLLIPRKQGEEDRARDKSITLNFYISSNIMQNEWNLTSWLFDIPTHAMNSVQSPFSGSKHTDSLLRRHHNAQPTVMHLLSSSAEGYQIYSILRVENTQKK